MVKIYQFYYDKTTVILNKNILGDKCQVVSLGIHALPGSKFYINKNIEPITISSNGNIFLDCKEHPITSIVIDRDNNIKTTPTIIDIMYKGVLENVR